jgi:hypothetical protein
MKESHTNNQSLRSIFWVLPQSQESIRGHPPQPPQKAQKTEESERFIFYMNTGGDLLSIRGRAQTPSATFLRDNVAWEKSTHS